MTTKLLDNKICTFKILLSWHFPREKQRFGRYSSLPPFPSPPQRRKFYFYCRLAFFMLGDSRESIRANHSQIETSIFIARQADSHEALEFPIRDNHATKVLAGFKGSLPLNRNTVLQSDRFRQP